jgi:hypothetical protein
VPTDDTEWTLVFNSNTFGVVGSSTTSTSSITFLAFAVLAGAET